ncbi:hypothetical protein ACXDHU_002255 [Klebsiella pneumoniae]|uniref:hypothetical protein n=1 Tax=Klebsiella variicola TaxID=244366 RepID=UPI000D744EC0|nr:hypothetical protein [Klebsiella variicola]PXL90148.1 hypothetical protein DMT18_12370 [Klebsiella variicola]
MNKSKAISRIERILRKLKDGTFTDSDIDVLFVTARELPTATKNIFEIGSFVAHNHQRDQGLINDMMLRNHLLLSLGFGRAKHDVKPELNEFPKFLPLLIKLQLRMFNDDHFKKKLGLKGGQINTARKKLNNKKSYEIIGDICKLTQDIGVNEERMIQEVLSLLNCADSIEYDVLFEELKDLLKREIPNVDLTPLDINRMKIAGILICLLNNIDFSLMDGVEAKTTLSICSDETVYVYGRYYIIHDKEPFKKISIMSQVFHAGYKVDELFDAHVTNKNIDAGDVEFNVDLGKVVVLQQ